MVKEAATDANIGKNSKDDSNCLFSFSKSLELSVVMSIFRIRNESTVSGCWTGCVLSVSAVYKVQVTPCPPTIHVQVQATSLSCTLFGYFAGRQPDEYGGENTLHLLFNSHFIEVKCWQ